MSSMDYERGNQANGCLDRFFKLTKHGTSVKTEIFAGITMFIASVYILAVIPNLLCSGYRSTWTWPKCIFLVYHLWCYGP